jgi:hypothetical protein
VKSGCPVSMQRLLRGDPGSPHANAEQRKLCSVGPNAPGTGLPGRLLLSFSYTQHGQALRQHGALQSDGTSACLPMDDNADHMLMESWPTRQHQLPGRCSQSMMHALHTMRCPDAITHKC